MVEMIRFLQLSEPPKLCSHSWFSFKFIQAIVKALKSNPENGIVYAFSSFYLFCSVSLFLHPYSYSLLISFPVPLLLCLLLLLCFSNIKMMYKTKNWGCLRNTNHFFIYTIIKIILVYCEWICIVIICIWILCICYRF